MSDVHGALWVLGCLTTWSFRLSLKTLSCCMLLAGSLSLNGFQRSMALDTTDAPQKIAVRAASLLTAHPHVNIARTPKPTLVALMLNGRDIADTEVIVWDDGRISVPMKTLGNFFDLSPQVSLTSKTLYLTDAQTQQHTLINWSQSQITQGDKTLTQFPHAPCQVDDSMIATGDVYVDQDTAEKILGAHIQWDPANLALVVGTTRQLAVLKAQLDAQGQDNGLASQAPIQTIAHPDVVHAAVEKITINQHTYSYSTFTALPGTGLTPQLINSTHALSHTLTVGVEGRVGGWDYQVKPTMVRYNGKMNFQTIDWHIQKETERHQLRIGNMDAGLSPLVSPTLPLWGVRYASTNATQPAIVKNRPALPAAQFGISPTMTPHPAPVPEQSAVGQTRTELEPITLEVANPLHGQIQKNNEEDADTQAVTTPPKDVTDFDAILPAHQNAYSVFAGRVPYQFYPIVATGSTPTLLPQSDKWVAGARYFDGVTDRLTLGLSTAVDRVFGAPRSPTLYNAFFNQLAPDLTGFSSYRRDPNYFQGETTAATLHYQIAPHLLWTLDAGVSHYSLLPGTNLPIAASALGKAGLTELLFQKKTFTAGLSLFDEDPHYYTPTTLYSSALYDRRGVGAHINGNLRPFKLNYALRYDRYQTNLGGVIPGGLILADNLTGSLTRVFGAKTTLNSNINWVTGHNTQKEYIQRTTDISLQRILPRHMTFEARYSQFMSNNLLLGALTTSQSNPYLFFSSLYRNNILSGTLDIPVNKALTVKVGTQTSTLLNDSFVKATLHYKRMTLEPLAQRSYASIQQQNILGMRVAYRFKSGKELGFNYSTNVLGYAFNKQMLANMSPIHSQQFYIDFVDVLAMANHKMRSLGAQADTKGVLSGTIYADLNRDNQYNDGEPGVKQVALLLDKTQTILTDKHGQYLIRDLTPGYHTLEIISDQVPLTLNTNDTVYNIQVAAGKVQEVNVGLTPQGGALTGHIHVNDVTRKAQNPDGLVLVLLDGQGKITNYTVANAEGFYKFNRIPSGDYRVDVEPALKTSGKYKVLQSPSPITVRPARHYQTVFQKDNLDFDIVSL